jgi:PAS domain S-box-containing protein
MPINRVLTKVRFAVWRGYLFAVILVVLSTWLKNLARPDIIPANVPILYILSIVLTASFFGLGPSILCCVISLFAFDYFFLSPVGTLTFDIEVVPISLVFFFVGIIISYLSSRLRERTREATQEAAMRKQNETELISYRGHLEELVKERTAALEKSNLDLTKEIAEHNKDEQALKKSEERLQRSQEIAHLGSWELDLSNNSLSWSDEVYRIFGLKPQEFGASYEAFLEAIHPDDRANVDAAYSASVSEGRDTYEIEHRVISKTTGEVRYVHEKCQHIRNESGQIIRSIGMVHDITERKEIEEALQKSYDKLETRVQERTTELAEANKSLETEIAEHKLARESVNTERRRFNEVLEMLPVYVILLSPDYHVPFANRFFRERFGESHGKRCFEYLFGRSEPCKICETCNVLKTKAPHHWEWTGPDGRNYDIFDFPFTDVDGSPLIMEVGIDVSEQKQAQAALIKAHAELEMRVQERTREAREARDYLDNLFNYANAPIIVWNPAFEITRFNHAFEQLTGRTADEVMGRTLDILFPDDSRDESIRHIREATYGERWEVVEIPIKHKDGTVRLLLWNSANLYAPDGKTVVATIAQGHDITERKKAEQFKDEFIGLVSHELRTPMTVINGSLRTAMSPGISAEDKEILLQNAIEGAGSLSAILENLLELSRYQADRLLIHTETVNIPVIASSVIEGLKTRSEERTFLMEFPDNLPPVQADPVRVERILYNLLENAVKYSSEKSVIKVFARKDKKMVVTRVADEGIGISTEDQGKIFELFERLGKESRYQGLGLGLVVCKRLVEAQGGHIWLESEPGKGSTFYFSLPVDKKAG